MRSPDASYLCSSCSSSFAEQTPYCGQCGADMRQSHSGDNSATTNSSLPKTISQNPPVTHNAQASTNLSFSNRYADHLAEKDSWLGKLVDRRYRVEAVLGRGGMGVIYKIKHQRMGKIAAMKVLHSDLAKNPAVVHRFHREAEAVSRLGHPNTVQVFDFGTENGALYLVMEYVKGRDLGAIIDRDGPVPFTTLVPLLRQICGSLGEAHALGVVHRDLKPENILVGRNHSGRDFVKVVDFGLAKLSEPETSSAVTSAGSIIGTPYYMSPEQIRAENVDHRADIYSLGAVMFRLLTGGNAFDARTPVGVLTKHLTQKVNPPSQIYPELDLGTDIDKIILRCMAKQPSDRYQTVEELLQDILSINPGQELGITSQSHRSPNLDDLSFPHLHIPLPDDIDAGIDTEMHLRRKDLDDFEARLHRNRYLRQILVPVIVLGLCGAGTYLLFWRPDPVQTAEIEPNNEPSQATLIAPDSPVTGTIGKRLSQRESDRDFYRFSSRSPGGSNETVSISVDAPANIDIRIDVYDTGGTLIKRSDEARVGGNEHLRRWQIRDGILVAISGADASPGHLPVENVSDSYSMTAVFSQQNFRVESEPNNNRADANTIRIGTPVSGSLDQKNDEDVFRIEGAAGTYKLKIVNNSDLRIAWRVDDRGDWSQSLSGSIRIKAGTTLSIRRKTNSAQQGPVPYSIDFHRE